MVGNESDDWIRELPNFPLEGFSFYGTAIKDRTKYLAGKAMTMDYFSHNKIKGHIEVDANTMMFFSIPFDDGWHAYVNGEEKALKKVDYGFTGLMLEPGMHHIELKYIPPMSRAGWIGFALGLIALVGLLRYGKNI